MTINNIKNKLKFTKDLQVENIKIPPYSLEAEQSILGSLMLDNHRWDYVIEKIIIEDFFIISHKIIFREMHVLIDIGKPIDLITLSEALENKNKLNQVGGFAYLAELSKNIPSISNIYAYIDIVRERAIIREMITAANAIAEAGYFPNGRKSEDLLNLAESRIFQIAEKRINKDTKPKNIDEVLEVTVSKIESFYKTPNNGVTGIDTGYYELNKKTAGLQKSDLIIIAARPAMGKTTFAMNICEYTAMLQDKPVLIFSLEMPCEQIMMRMLASLSRVSQSKIRTGQLNDNDWKKISGTMSNLLKKKNIYIDDSSELTPTEIRLRSRRIFREFNGLSLIMIDYLQLIRVPSLSFNRTLEITEISRSLKSLAKELHVPVIALSQLNRSLEQRADKRPMNSDLRESGSIEQDADLIMFIYRDEIYNEHSPLQGIAEIIIGKQRNGPVGNIKLTFNNKIARFDNYIDYYDNSIK
ncbi:replicative DNA helicase [Enterobacteriaceae endosymbiont of Neohaemonia nigricornis]|uniref:replicative DNA helicase n=1 Tax=Enterobacteriaceae endosymbiont of Neohaemonia nigricornis TaxID=2675792 RepID=UPI001449081A|nr:replicative DNA helicase [Enterobacteriaceae endosymbiont of Neohaemonia nigricornis]QJC30243.1 replicative DNA helicase [Enterobacteriaceae endosymbiont of Neohaemonia nigricornis]